MLLRHLFRGDELMDTQVKFDFPGILDLLTNNDDWEKADGPETGSGLDYYYQTTDGGHQAHVNVDEVQLRVVVDGMDVYDGPFPEDEMLRPFIEGDISALESPDEPPNPSE